MQIDLFLNSGRPNGYTEESLSSLFSLTIFFRFFETEMRETKSLLFGFWLVDLRLDPNNCIFNRNRHPGSHCGFEGPHLLLKRAAYDFVHSSLSDSGYFPSHSSRKDPVSHSPNHPSRKDPISHLELGGYCKNSLVCLYVT